MNSPRICVRCRWLGRLVCVRELKEASEKTNGVEAVASDRPSDVVV